MRWRSMRTKSRQGITAMEIEIRRAFDWIAVDRAEFWRKEIRRGMEAVARAKDELQKKPLPAPRIEHERLHAFGHRRAEGGRAGRAALKRADLNSEAVRKWTRSLQHELNEYIGSDCSVHAVPN